MFLRQNQIPPKKERCLPAENGGRFFTHAAGSVMDVLKCAGTVDVKIILHRPQTIPIDIELPGEDARSAAVAAIYRNLT